MDNFILEMQDGPIMTAVLLIIIGTFFVVFKTANKNNKD